MHTTHAHAHAHAHARPLHSPADARAAGATVCCGRRGPVVRRSCGSCTTPPCRRSSPPTTPPSSRASRSPSCAPAWRAARRSSLACACSSRTSARRSLTPHDANGLADPYVEVLHVPGTCAHYHPTLALLWPLHTGAARGLRDRQLLPHSPPAFPSHIPRPHSPAAFPCRCGRASHSRSACCPCAARRSAPRGRASGCSCLCPPRARGR